MPENGTLPVTIYNESEILAENSGKILGKIPDKRGYRACNNQCGSQRPYSFCPSVLQNSKISYHDITPYNPVLKIEPRGRNFTENSPGEIHS